MENLSAEEAVRVLQERIGSDGTLALISLLHHSHDALLAKIDARLERLEARIDRRFDAVDGRFDGIEQRFEGFDRRFETLEHRFDELGYQVSARLDGTLRYAITFSLSLLGLVAAIATGILALRW
ncbi:MAG TPA: hypothetical protein VF282_03825 [Bacillota bacterium]